MTAPLDSDILADNFAGGGGASLGISNAFGRPIDIAVNHDPEALAMHAANHPETLHLRENVWHVKPKAVCKGRRVRLAWFSPDCTHHSKAKGGKPREKKIRGLCWVAVRWARDVRPDCIMLENVEEFQDYCPLDKTGHPIKSRKGELFRRFVRALRRLGYAVEWRVLVAADYGAPTIRKRLYLIARCDGKPIVWPEPTHAKDPGASLWTMHCKKWRGAHECIDWSLPCPSIFERQRPLAENTNLRVAEGLRRFVFDCPQPFIVGIDNKSSGAGAVWSVLDPLRTVTGENRFALAMPYLAGVGGRAGQSPPRCADQPMGTITAKGDVALVMPYLVQTGYGERPGQAPRVMSLEKPLGTIVGSGKHALCAAFLAKHYTGVVGQDLRQPMGTVTAVDHHSLVCAFLTKYYGTGNGSDLREPMGTVTSKDRMGLVYVYGDPWRVYDIGLRMLQPRELARAQGFPDSYVLTGTKTSQVARIGNSVCPGVAEALVRANFAESAAGRMAA